MFNNVSRGFGAAVSALGAPGADDAAVAALAEGLADGAPPDRQRDAAERLRDLLIDHPQAQAAVGSAGLPALAAALRRAPRDADVTRAVLEALTLAVGDGLSGGGGAKPSVSTAAINCELFSRDAGNLAAVLTVLDPPPAGLGTDVAARLHALQLLAALAGHAAPRLVAAVLASPGGVARVMDALGDAHDAVRAEAQALLIALARASPDVQKIAAFDGAFERLLGTVRAAGGVAGGVAVQDALELVGALVGGNPATLTLFREGGGVAGLVPLLACQAGRKPPPQVAANVGAALGVVAACCAAPAATAPADAAAARTACQEPLLQHGTMPALLNLCLENGGVQDEGVRVKAMHTLAKLVDGHAAAQTALARANITVVGRPLPVVQALLRTALRAPTPAERAAGDAVLRALCFRNGGVQMELLATVTPVPPGSLPATFGQELVRGLLNADPTLAVPSAAVTAHLLRGNPGAKAHLTTLPVEAPPATGGPLRYILPTLATTVTEYFGIQAAPDEERARPLATAAAMLLAVWLADCPAAISALLTLPGVVDTFVGVIADRCRPPLCDDFVRGFAAVLLGECLLFCGDDVQAKAIAHDAILGRAGLAKFLAVADGLRTHPAVMHPVPDDRPASTPVLDADMRAFLVDFEGRFQAHITAGPAPAAGRPAAPAETDALAQAQSQIAALEEQLRQLRTAPPPPPPPPTFPVANGGLPADVTALQARCTQLQTAADQARADADAARATAAKCERDLADLAGAYASLEAHAASLKERVASLESSGGGGAPLPPPPSAPSPADIERRIAEAAAKATAEAEDGINDLLVCLGQEERKVELLSARLAELGVDAAAIVAGVGGDDLT